MALRTYGILLIAALALAGCGVGGGAPDSTLASPGGSSHIVAAESRLLDSSEDTRMPNVGDTAPDFQYTLGDRTIHKLSDLRGKKVLLNFWATWCEPCRAEMPDLQQVHDT